MNTESILLLVDPDGDFRAKVDFSYRMAQTSNSSIILLNPLDGESKDPGFLKEKQKINYLKIREVVSDYPHSELFKPSSVLKGDLIETLNSIGIQEDIKMFITGTNKLKNSTVIKGDNKLDQLQRAVDYPVVFLKEPFRDSEIRDIGIIMDEIDLSYEKGLQYLVDLANSMHAKIHMMALSDPDSLNNEDTLDSVMQMAEKYQPESYTINSVFNANVIEGMIFFTKKKKLDMIAMNSSTLSSNVTNGEFHHLFDRLECHVLWQHAR
jgi:hypothetical protein